MKWGDRYYPDPGGPPRLTVHVGCGGNIGADLRCDRCGKAYERGAIEFRPGPGAAAARRRGRTQRRNARQTPLTDEPLQPN